MILYNLQKYNNEWSMLQNSKIVILDRIDYELLLMI